MVRKKKQIMYIKKVRITEAEIYLYAQSTNMKIYLQNTIFKKLKNTINNTKLVKISLFFYKPEIVNRIFT